MHSLGDKLVLEGPTCWIDDSPTCNALQNLLWTIQFILSECWNLLFCIRGNWIVPTKIAVMAPGSDLKKQGLCIWEPDRQQTPNIPEWSKKTIHVPYSRDPDIATRSSEHCTQQPKLKFRQIKRWRHCFRFWPIEPKRNGLTWSDWYCAKRNHW